MRSRWGIVVVLLGLVFVCLVAAKHWVGDDGRASRDREMDCPEAPPSTDPDIVGIVTDKQGTLIMPRTQAKSIDDPDTPVSSQDADQVQGESPLTLRVEENPAQEWGSLKAVVSIDGSTCILRSRGGDFMPLDPADLAKGQKVAVWYREGIIPEIYPTLVAADFIVLME